MISPWCSTTTCCASAITARITCSMRRIVRPSLRLNSRNTSTSRSHSVGVIPAITSSSSSSRGRVASARATSSRLRSGRVSEAAGRSRLLPNPSFSTISAACLFAAETPFSRSSAPTITLSMTDKPANGFTIWKVRPMPAAQIWSARSPPIGSPANRIPPPSGAYTPATMLNIVVLPAPFGPISATRPPCGTSNDAWVTALRPRNDFCSPRTSSRSLISRFPACARAWARCRAAGT